MGPALSPHPPPYRWASKRGQVRGEGGLREGVREGVRGVSACHCSCRRTRCKLTLPHIPLSLSGTGGESLSTLIYETLLPLVVAQSKFMKSALKGTARHDGKYVYLLSEAEF